MIDVAIVGGGPAGAAAAIACARAGLRAVVFERALAVNPADESIGADVVALLRQLGIDGVLEGTPFAGVTTGTRFAVFGGANPVAGFHVSRIWLDGVLRERAGIRPGVEAISVVRDGPGFVVGTSTRPMSVRAVIDAAGRRPFLARHFSLKRMRRSPPLIAWRDVVPTEGAGGVLSRFTPLPDGWRWQADTKDGRTIRVRLQPARVPGRPLSLSATAHAARWQRIARLAGEGWFLAGDAAGALDPAYGAGIGFALRSGLAAGSAVAACLNDPRSAAMIAACYHAAVSDVFETAEAALAASYRAAGICFD